MPDDLSKLTPHDPSAVDPDWTDKRQRILDGVLATDAPRRPRRWRWVAGVAAAALVAVGVGGLVQQLRPEPWATPASPTATVELSDLVAAQSLLVFGEDGAKLCHGAVEFPPPPKCEGIPVEGLSQEDVPWAERRGGGGVAWAYVTVTGTFDGTTMTVVEVYEEGDPEAPQPAWAIDDELDRFRDLCTDPTTGQGAGDRPLEEVVMELPGYQGSWPNGKTNNVAVTRDVEAARKTLTEKVKDDFCVGTIPGPSAADGEAMAQSVSAVPGVDAAHFAYDVRGAVILVELLTDDEEVKSEIESLVGPDMWPSVVIRPFFYPVRGSALPEPSGSPSLSNPSAAHDSPVALEGALLEVDGDIGLCYGGGMLITEHYPPGEPMCGGGFVPVSGLAMPKPNERYGILVGTFDGTTFHAIRLYGPGEEDRPRSPLQTMPPEPPDVCEEQTGTGTSAEEELNSAAAALPGYQGLWLTSDMSASHYRVAVTHGVDEAQAALLEKFDVLLCVATVPGPDEATLRAAEEAVMALWPRKPGELEPYVSTDAWAGPTGMSLRVTVLNDTDEIRSKVMEAVGPEVAPYTQVIPAMFPVDPSALEPRVDTPTPMPPGPATPLVITAADRQRAEESVASDLQDADGTSAKATMAKATFEQYEALWTIDVPYPPGPPSGDTEVLVVTLSASLGNRVMHGGPPGGPALGKAAGTIKVIDAKTGESVIYATLLGDEPQAERIAQFPGPIENVELPEGFR